MAYWKKRIKDLEQKLQAQSLSPADKRELMLQLMQETALLDSKTKRRYLLQGIRFFEEIGDENQVLRLSLHAFGGALDTLNYQDLEFWANQVFRYIQNGLQQKDPSLYHLRLAEFFHTFGSEVCYTEIHRIVLTHILYYRQYQLIKNPSLDSPQAVKLHGFSFLLIVETSLDLEDWTACRIYLAEYQAFMEEHGHKLPVSLQISLQRRFHNYSAELEAKVKAYDEALSHLDKAFEKVQQQEVPAYTLSSQYYRKGLIYHELGDYHQAYSDLRKSLQLAEREQLPKPIWYCHQALAETAAKLGHFEEAYQYAQLYSQEKEKRHRQEIEYLVPILERLKRKHSFAFVKHLVPLPSSTIKYLDAHQADFVERCSSLIQRHYSDSAWGAAAAAEELGLSERHLYRQSKQVFGMSFADLLSDFRLNMARLLLAQGTKHIGRTVQAVGYRSLSHFSKSFKARFGLLPKDL